jgi:hypothetical protein
VPADAFAAIGFLDNDLLIVPSLDLIVIRQVGVTCPRFLVHRL